MGPYGRSERRPSMAERRPSVSYTPPSIPHLAGLEKPQDPHLKLDHCDVLILGTGLVESILAASLSWAGVEVLHIDQNKYYGDLASTLTVEQIKKWVMEVNQGRINHFQEAQLYVPGGSQTNNFCSKDYGIDLTPKIMFAKSDLLALLVKSRVYRYLEFQSLSNFHVFENGQFNRKVSNTTKQDLFTDQRLSLTDKRYLMKFLKFALIDIQDEEKNKLIWDNAKTPIGEFLKHQFKLAEPQINELVYSIALCSKELTKAPEAMARIRRYLTSVDVYGPFPVMMLKFGGPGEISQGFCRSAAVAGTTYKLDTRLIDYDQDKMIARFSDGSSVKIKEKLIISPTQIPPFLRAQYENEVVKDLQEFYVTRLTAIIKRDCHQWTSDHETSAIVVFPPHSLPTDNNESVQVIIQNGGSGICPVGESIWYAQLIEQDLSRAKLDLQLALDKMQMTILKEEEEEEIDEQPQQSSIDAAMDDVDYDDNLLKPTDMIMNSGVTPPSPQIVSSSFKLGDELNSFTPKKPLDFVCKLGYVQKTYIKPNLVNVLLNANESNNIIYKTLAKNPNVIFSNMPSAELSYDGVVSETKGLFSRVTGSDEDFFDVDFEDDEEFGDDDDDTPAHPNASIIGNGDLLSHLPPENAIESDDEDDDDKHHNDHHHHPFDVDQMEL